MGKIQCLQKMVLGRLDRYMKKRKKEKEKKLDHFLKLYMKINSKWVKDLNVTPEIIKILEENISNKLFDISLSNIFLDGSFKAKTTKAKINKWDYIKLKSLCTTEEAINKIKRQPSEWEKVFVNDISNKEFNIQNM